MLFRVNPATLLTHSDARPVAFAALRLACASHEDPEAAGSGRDSVKGFRIFGELMVLAVSWVLGSEFGA